MMPGRSTVLAVLTLAALAIARPADAAKVLVFNSTRFVDSHQGSGYPPGSQESDNVQAALQSIGHTVSTIAGPDDPVGACGPNVSQPGTVLATAAEYSAALAANEVFVIPETDRKFNPALIPVRRAKAPGAGAEEVLRCAKWPYVHACFSLPGRELRSERIVSEISGQK